MEGPDVGDGDKDYGHRDNDVLHCLKSKGLGPQGRVTPVTALVHPA